MEKSIERKKKRTLGEIMASHSQPPLFRTPLKDALKNIEENERRRGSSGSVNLRQKQKDEDF